MADDSNTEPTIASMTPDERTALARTLGVAGYNKRLTAEIAAARAAAASTLGGAAPRAAMATIRATEGLAESDVVDLASLDDSQRAAWIRHHGIARYSALLQQQLKGKNNFLGRRR